MNGQLFDVTVYYDTNPYNEWDGHTSEKFVVLADTPEMAETLAKSYIERTWKNAIAHCSTKIGEGIKILAPAYEGSKNATVAYVLTKVSQTEPLTKFTKVL